MSLSERRTRAEHMARCSACGRTIRKAEIREGCVFRNGLLYAGTVHEKCLGSSSAFPMTAELRALEVLLKQHASRSEEMIMSESRRAALRADEREARLGEALSVICGMSLELGRHSRGDCRAHGCPVPRWCGHDFDWRDPEERRLHTEPIACECSRCDGKPSCHACGGSFCFCRSH